MRKTFGGGNAVALAIEEAADLGEVAVPLHCVVEHRRLHEEGVVALEDALYALLVVRDEDRGLLRLHVPPHLLVDRYLRVLYVASVWDGRKVSLG